MFEFFLIGLAVSKSADADQDTIVGRSDSDNSDQGSLEHEIPDSTSKIEIAAYKAMPFYGIRQFLQL